MAQYVINTGALPNDGTGTPLRTAFNDTNLNFNQVFAAGPVGSNIQISNNTITTTNTNGNLILATNGTGVITAAAAIQPDQANLRMIGAYNNRFNTVYTQYLDTQSAVIASNLTVNGNLYVAGNTVSVDVATLNVANTVITAAAGAPYPALADGAGLAVGGAGATFLYSATANAWAANLPIQAPAFIGDGSQLTNVAANVSAAEMLGNTINANVLYSSLVTVGALANLSVTGNAQFGQNILSNTITTGEITAVGFYGNGAGLTGLVGSNVVGNVANATYATFAGTAGTANVAATATQALNAQTAVNALNAQTANTAQFADIANWANCADLATTAYQANSAVVAGYANTIGVQTSITVTGNIVTGAIKTDNYLFANGTPATFGGGTNYSNANVAAYLPTYSGDLLNLGNITSYGTANLGNTNIDSTLTVGVVSAQGNISGAGIYANGFFYANGIPFTGAGYVLGDQQFYGNGSTGPYTLTQASTDNAVLVTINGLTQTPGTTYFVVGNTISFSDGINTNELVDIRFLGTAAGGTVNTGNISFTGDTVYDIRGMFVNNSDLSHGPTSGIVIPANGNSQTPAQFVNTYGNMVITVGTNPGDTSNWIFGNDGNLTLPTNTSSINYANGQPYGGSGGGSANTGNITFNENTISSNVANVEIAIVGNGTGGVNLLSGAGGYSQLQNDSGNVSSYVWVEDGNAYIESGSSTWTFDNTGNLTAPGDISTAGNVTAANFTTTGSSGNISGANVVSAVTFTATGNVYADYLIGNGSQLTNLSAAGNTTEIQFNNGGEFAASDSLYFVDNGGEMTLYADYISSYVFTNDLNGQGNNITIAAQYGNSVVVDTLGGVSAAGNIRTAGSVSATGNITGAYFIGNGSQLTNLPVSNISFLANSAATLTLATSGELLVASNGTASNFVVNSTTPDIDLRNASGTGSYTQGATQYVMRVGGTNNLILDNTGLLSAPGAISAAGNIRTAGNVSAQGNIAAQGLVSAVGNIVTDGYFVGNFQGNITGNIVVPGSNTQVLFNTLGNVDAVGGFTFDTAGPNLLTVLGTASVQGNVNAGNVATGNISAAGNIAAANFTTTGSGGNISGANVVSAQTFSAAGAVYGNSVLTGNVIGGGTLKLIPDSGNASAYLDVYLTSGPDIHIAGNGESVILGRDDFANVTVNVDGNVTIQASTGNAQVWNFGSDGNLTVPGAINGTTNSSVSLNALNDGDNPSVQLLNWDVANSAPSTIVSVDFGGVTINTGVTDTPRQWSFDNSGNLTAPGNVIAPTFMNNGNLAINASAANANISFNVAGDLYGQLGTGVAFGYLAGGTGNTAMQSSGIAIGTTAGQSAQGLHGIAIGWNTGTFSQGGSALALGENAGWINQGNTAIAIGAVAGRQIQGANAVAIGTRAGFSSQGGRTIAIGLDAGNTSQGADSIAIGTTAGLDTQGTNSVAIGVYAGNITQGSSSVAVGGEAGQSAQGLNSVAIGVASGAKLQGNAATALGSFAGQYSQGGFAVAIGSGAAYTRQGNAAIAIGTDTSAIDQGDYAIAIGAGAVSGNVQANNSIIIDATGTGTTPAANAGLYVTPVRNDTGNTTNAVYYNTSTKEVTYGPAGGGSGAAEAPFEIQTSAFNATAGSRYGVNTTGGSVQATLPATPATGAAIFFADAGGAYATNNLTIDPGAGSIMGISDIMVVNTNNQNFGLFYNGTTWRTY